jgi:hypothetical protein
MASLQQAEQPVDLDYFPPGELGARRLETVPDTISFFLLYKDVD